MGSENEPAKLLLPYLQRADELQKHEPLVAYYCRLYAMERGMRISPKERTKTTNAILVSLMNQLEKDKKSLKLGPEDNLYVEGFASNVFAKADKQDRAARADLNTAKTFYAASIFFEILNQFGELQPDLEQKQKYAAWKAADIRKALKEGRKPEPGPPGGDKDLSLFSSTSIDAYDLGSSEPTSANQPGLESDASTEFHDNVNHHQPSTNTLPSHSFPTSDYPSNDFKTPTQFHDDVNYQASPKNISSHSYPTSDYPPNDFNAPPPANSLEDPSYPQPYHHQPYPHESQPPLPQNYPSHESPSSLYSHETPPPIYSLPNFQSYPSFTDTNLPTAPSHYPSYYQGSDASFSHQSAPPPPPAAATHYSSPPKYTSNSRNGTHQEPVPEIPVSAQTFQYDSNYQPPPEKIAEAHKAARFAVGALAFDDVSVAVDFLIKSLELLTKPSASK